MQILTARNLAVLAGVSSLVTLGAQALAAARALERERLVHLADAITTDLARLDGMPPGDKRHEALRRLREQAPRRAHRLLPAAQFGLAVEQAWHFHAKPRLKGR